MGVLRTWSGDGLSAGTLTTSSAGTGDTAFDTVVTSSGLAISNSGVRPPRIAITKPTTTVCNFLWDYSTTHVQGSARFYWVSPTTPPSAGVSIFAVRSGSAQLCLRVQWASTITGMRLLDAVNSNLGGTGTNSVPMDGTRYRIEVEWSCSTTAGTASLKVFSGDTTTQVGTTVTATGANLGAANWNRTVWGFENTTPEVTVTYVDDLQVDDVSHFIGAYVPTNVAPTVNAGVDQNVGGGDVVTLTASASDTDGTIASYAWSQTAGNSVTLAGSGASRTFTAPYDSADQARTFSVTVTDDGGLTATDTVVVNTSKWRRWFKNSSGVLVPVHKQVFVPAATPAVVTASVVGGDGQGDVTYSVAPNGHTVTGVVITKTPATWTTTKTALSGTQHLSALTNGTLYTVTVAAIVDGVTDTAHQQTLTFTPNAPNVRHRPLGFYDGVYSYPSNFTSLTVYPDLCSNYVQPQVPISDPASTPTNGIPPGNPYADGTWYRDFKTLTWSGFKATSENDMADKGIEHNIVMAYQGSSACTWIANGRPANPAGYDWAVAQLDTMLNKVLTRYNYAPDVTVRLACICEPDVFFQQGTMNTSAVNLGKFYNWYFGHVRTILPNVPHFIWFGGSQTAWINTVLTNITTNPPDGICTDPYVNSNVLTTVQSCWNADLNKFRVSGGVWKANYDRLSALHPTGNIWLGISETAISTDASDTTHTDAAIATWIKGDGTVTWPGMRQVMVNTDVEFATWFNHTGTNGAHNITDGTHPLAKAAMTTEMKKSIAG